MINKKETLKGAVQIISGGAQLEKFFKKSFVSLLDIRRDFDLPIKKRAGFPSLDVSEFREWCVDFDVDPDHPETISTESLSKIATKKRIDDMADQTLIGLEQIVQFTGRPADQLMQWQRDYPDCPIEKPQGKDAWRRATVSTKTLHNFMNAHSIPFAPQPEFRAALPFQH